MHAYLPAHTYGALNFQFLFSSLSFITTWRHELSNSLYFKVNACNPLTIQSLLTTVSTVTQFILHFL